MKDILYSKQSPLPTEFFFILCVSLAYVCLRVMYICVYVCVIYIKAGEHLLYMHMGVREQPPVSILAFRPGWGSSLSAPACFQHTSCPPGSPGLSCPPLILSQVHCCYRCVLCGFWWFKQTSSHLHVLCFTHGNISLAPIRIFSR